MALEEVPCYSVWLVRLGVLIFGFEKCGLKDHGCKVDRPQVRRMYVD